MPASPPNATLPSLTWDIFCTVIDNYGDAGVCWRLAKALVARNQVVRLWMDDLTPLVWMAPDHLGHGSALSVRHWQGGPDAVVAATDAVGDVVIEAFGCEPPTAFVARMAARAQPPVWINLEYLSAEAYVERCHRLPSPVMSGPGRGLTKHFFYPGFTERTGGLLRPDHLADSAQAASHADRLAWLQRTGQGQVPALDGECWVSLFCYEPPALVELIEVLATQTTPHRLWVTHGRAHAHLTQTLSTIDDLPSRVNKSLLSISYLPALDQTQYDTLLDLCDVNFVRGEDSLVRALWAGRPAVWHIYPQHDGAHWAKLEAYLDMVGASDVLWRWHMAWNGGAGAARLTPQDWLDLRADRSVARVRTRLSAHDDLATQLVGFSTKARGPHSAYGLYGHR